MPRTKGDGLGKLGGRKKGTPNKVTKEQRELVLEFVRNNWEDFQEAYRSIVEPEKKCSVFLGVMQYGLPKLAAVEYKDKTPAKTFKDELDELSGEVTRGK